MMREQKLSFCLAALAASALMGTQSAIGQGGTVNLNGTQYEVVPVGQIGLADQQPIPQGTPIQRIQFRRGSSQGSVVAGESMPIEVYRNVEGPIFATNGVNRLLADDIETTAAFGCNLQVLNIGVNRATNAPAPPGFSITQLSVWDRCPSAAGAVMLLDLLDGVPLVFATNGAFEAELDITGEELPIPATFWLAIAFNKADAGWIGGSAPTIGFSQNVIHIDDPARPQLRCNAAFVPTPAFPDLYSGMYAAIMCIDAVPFFVGYQANIDSDVFYGGGGCGAAGLEGCGDGINLQNTCETTADNIKPIVPDCRLHSYAINVAGLSGEFDMEFELYTNDATDPDAPKPGVPIAGTRACYHGMGNAFLERASFVFDGSVTLPERFWLLWADNDEDAGPIAAGGPAEIGDSELVPGVEAFEVFVGGAWDEFELPECGATGCGNFQITVNCLGEEPVGACCSRSAGTCEDGMFVRDCPRTVGRWLPEATCDTAPFVPACGSTACCKIDPGDSSNTICDNEIPEDCTAANGDPTIGVFCAEVESCGIPSCIAASGDCLSAHLTPGCFDNDCCNTICRTDSFCCDLEWDDNCASLAADVCVEVIPPNDQSADAEVVQAGTPEAPTLHDFNTEGANTDGPVLPEECLSAGSLVIGKDIWYQITPAQDGALTVRLCGDTTDFDTRLALYEGCESPPTLVVACDDDGCDPGSTTGAPSVLTEPVSGGTCYLIRVGGFGINTSGSGQMALSFVPQTCSGTMTISDPPNSTVDARLPHPLTSLVPRQGVNVLTVHAPAGVLPGCFELCETDDEGNPNMIASVLENPAGTYTITLARTITTGAVTTLTYLGDDTTVTVISQPGNVNGTGGASAADLTALVECLNGNNTAVNCPGNPYSRDLDHSGAFRPADLLAAANALNGADTLDATNGDSQPSTAGCP